MTKAERLQKIVIAQERELRRLRKLLATCKVAQADFWVEGNTVKVVVTAIGVDEYYFTDQAKPQLEKIANAIAGQINGKKSIEIQDEILDDITGEVMQGAVSPGV